MDGIPYYGNFIRTMDDNCQHCIVCIRTYDEDGANLSVGTGIIVVSGEKSCFVITSSALTKNKKAGTVEFSDGFIHQIHWGFVRSRNEVSLIGIFETMVHWETANFSNNEAVKGQRVFTCGYNSTPRIRRYISGNIVCGAGRRNNQVVQFVHGCSTGKIGHTGSAVFNETQQLVGMNFFYTRCIGEDYCRVKDQQEQTPGGKTSGPGGKTSGPGGKTSRAGDEETSGLGGLVSALDLQTIIGRIQLILPGMKGQSVQETLQSLQNILRDAEVVAMEE